MCHDHSHELFSRLRAKGLTMFFISFVLELIMICKVIEITTLNTFKCLFHCDTLVAFRLDCEQVTVIAVFLKLLLTCPTYFYLGTERLHLRSAEEYRYLNQSNCLSIDNVDDAEEFRHLRVGLNYCRGL
jgi:hypothetical protein